MLPEYYQWSCSYHPKLSVTTAKNNTTYPFPTTASLFLTSISLLVWKEITTLIYSIDQVLPVGNQSLHKHLQLQLLNFYHSGEHTCVREPAGFCRLFVHPHPESFPSVTAKVIYTMVGPRGTRQDQSTVALPAELSRCAQGAADAARQGTHETSGSSEPRAKIFSQGSSVSFVSFKQPLAQDNVGGKLKGCSRS